MRFSTLLPMLLAAGVAQAQFRGGQGGGQNGGQNGQGGNGQGGNGQNNNNGGNNNNNGGNNNNNNNGGNNNNNNNGGNNNNQLCLNPANVQENSNKNGQEAGAEAGQAASATDPANFINFCEGKTLTNGLQVREGSCNGIPLGDMPAANRMVSAVIQSPEDGSTIQANQPITFSVKIANLQAGAFTNPDVTYYAAPQSLNGGGQVIGHTHITVQNMGGQKQPNNAPNAEVFDFFKGINDNGDGNGLLSAQLNEGLPDGIYRVCSMTSSSNHAPVMMPVAQRGAQDDCIRFTVGGNGGNNNNNGGNNNNNNGGNNNNNGGQGQGQQGGQGQGQGQGQQGGQGQGQGQQGGQGQGQGQQGGQGQGQGQQGGQGQGQGQGQQGGQGQGQQGGQGGQGGRGRGRGRGRFNKPKFAMREFIA